MNGRLGNDIRRDFGRDSKIIEDWLQRCASRDLTRLILGDLIRQKDVMMGLAKGQTVVNMGKRGLFKPSRSYLQLFSSALRYICDVCDKAILD